VIRIDIDVDACVGCRACIIQCPEGVFDVFGEYVAVAVNPERCTACMICEQLCYEGAIKITP